MEPQPLIPPHQVQGPLHQAMARAMIASVARTWTVIVLELERQEGGGVGDFSFSLSSPEGHPPLASDLDEDALCDAALRLDEAFRAHGKHFDRVRYTVTLKPGASSCKFVFDY